MLKLGTVGHGRQGLADGTNSRLRLDRVGGLVVNTGVAEYWESMSRGKLFTATTSLSGVAPGTALSTSPPFVLYNPPSSGVTAVLVDLEVAFVSGTLGAGNIVLAAATGQNLSAANLGTSLSTLASLLGANLTSQCRALQAPTLSATPTLVRNLWYTGAFVTNATLYFGEARKNVQGMFGVAPGGALCVQEVGAAGTTPLVAITMAWIEVPSIFSL